ncbi:MAG: hypothetical protein JKX85_11085 [Phycisphaeraceae bacterium]|nr:hypothetical protein [Phycisphaeraceae bacterium]
MRTRIPFIILLVLAAMFIGCTTPNNLSISKDNAVVVATSTRSVAKMDGLGNLTAVYEGVSPTQTMIDDTGVWMNTPGQGGWLIFDPITGKVSLWSPKDTIITGLKITPNPDVGKSSFEAASIQANISTVAKVYADQFIAGVNATQDMSKAEASARLAAMQVVGEIAPDIARVIIDKLYPAAALTVPAASTPVTTSPTE